MKLDDLKPVAVPFNLMGLSLVFRPWTIQDDLKAVEICGGKSEFLKAFENFDFEKISLISWYQLEKESQLEVIKSVECTEINHETGEEVRVNQKPIEKFRSLFAGLGAQVQLLTDLTKCKGLNIPDFEDDEELKKWMDQLILARQQTGL